MTLLALLGAAGCSFEPGTYSAVPIAANAVTCACNFTDGGSRTLRIEASADDAEEVDGVMDLTSEDLDLGQKTVGLRFPDVTLPPGAVITAAYVQFEGDDSQSEATTTTIRGQLGVGLPFTDTASDLTTRVPLTTASVAWDIPAWVQDRSSAAERTPALAPIIQEIVDQNGWTSDLPLVLLFAQGTGHRTGESFDGTAGDAPQLVITYTTGLVAEIPTCAEELTRDDAGFLTNPQATCDTLEGTLGGLNAACGYPQTVECTVVDRTGPGFTDLPDSYPSDVCVEECTPNAVDAPTCNEYDPVELVACLERGNPLATCQSLHAAATHAGTDEPVCVVSGSPLAFHAIGQRSRCEVEGTSEITIGDQEPKKEPATDGVVEVLGSPCPGGDCYVHSSFLLDMEPITFDVRWASDPTFDDLGAAGAARETTLLEQELAIWEPDTVDGTGTGRRGDDGLAVTAANSDPLEVGVRWTERTCDMTGDLSVGVGDDGTCADDDTIACRSDADCEGVGGGVCELPSTDDADMVVSVLLDGTLVNQPPDAVAGADQSIECTSSAGATFTLDGRGSSDPDGNLADVSWRAGSRTGAEISDDLRATQSLGVGGTGIFVLRVLDALAQVDEDATVVSVVDTTPPTVSCNAAATIRPRDPATTFTASATDTCDTSVPPAVTAFDCFELKQNGIRVSKLDSCKVSYTGGALTVEHSGGVGTHITWTVEAVDDAGNVGEADCEIVTVQ